jgi:hypothetical protein
VVIAEGHLTGTSPSDPNMDNSHGLSIYFPPNGDFLDPLYIQVLDFPDDNQWDEFLQAYINLFDDTQGPQVFISFPSNGSTLQNTQPTIMATLTDVGGGRVDPSTIELTFDGKLVDLEDLTFDIATGQLQYQPPTTLAATTHTIKLTVKDLAGNPGQTAFVSFRIAPLVLKRGIQLLSIPLKLDTADPTVVFGAQDFTLVRWLPNDTRTSKYRFYPDPYASLIPPDADPNQTTTPIVSQPPAGLGYWVKLPTDTPALLGAGDVVDAPNGYAVRLLRGPGLSGWNLLGNPFNESIGWSSVQFRREGRRLTLTRAVEAGWTTGVLYGYAPNVLNPDMLGHYEFGGPGEGALDPWKAYWVQVNEDVEVIIFPGSGVGSRSTPGEGRAPAAPVGGWQIQLIAVTPEGEDPCNYVGLAVGAEEGRDAQDIAEPPPLGPDQVRLSLPHREWKGRAAGDYARDLRPAGAKRVEWTVEVQSPAGPPEVTLRWKGLPTVPPEYHLFLEDETAQQTVFLKTQSAYRFTPSPAGETRRFRLRAEHTATRTALKIVGLSVQRTRGDSYGASYTLTLPAQVQVQVLSITGRPVATVLEQTRAAGTHTETWDGRDGWGRPLPNGYYLIEVTARTETNEMDRAIGGISMVR